LSIFFNYGCQSKDTGHKPSEKIPVKAMKVQPRDLYNILNYAGDVKAQDEAIIYPKVSGKIIEKVRDEGSLVKKGEVICYLDRDEVGLKFEKAPVESTLTGVVGRVFVDIGENVNSQTPIAFVVNAEKVKINLDIPEKYTPGIFLLQEARIRVDAWPQDEFSGAITKISPVMDLSTRSAPIEITVDNPQGSLRSGMFARVDIVLEEKKGVLAILQEAVIGREPDAYVFIVENNKAKLKKVSLGIRQGPYYEIISGIKNGDLVVIMGQQKLYEEALVEAEVL
jgi:multidrug efflux pump subunit AcrA (membrane-fusion protein)